MSKTYLFILSIFIFCSCSQKYVSDIQANEKAPYPKIELSIRLGEAHVLSVPTNPDFKPLKLFCNNTQIVFYEMASLIKAYVAVPVKVDTSSFNCELTFLQGEKENKTVVASVKVLSKEFESEVLNVPQTTIDLSKKDLERYLKEKEIIAKAYSNPNQAPLFSRPFIAPLDSVLTSTYGRKRIYNNQKENQHGGVDFRAAVDTPVPASNSGKVVLAMDLFFSGKTVLIDHGLGIFTMYAHLNKLNTKVGEYVPQKAIIGHSGMTGRVSGPHLHWGVRVNAINVDGMEFIKLK